MLRRAISIVLAMAGSAWHATAWSQSALMRQARDLFKPIPDTPPSLAGNPATPARIELGKMLYFDPRLSENHSTNCNACHMIGMGGASLVATSPGHRSQHGNRNAPTIYNAVFDVAQVGNEVASDRQQQVGGALVDPVEAGTTEEQVIEQLKGIPGYAMYFAKAFPGEHDPITFDNLRKAIAVFEATLITPGAPFDRYLKGDERALDSEQKAGLALFISKGCSSCHNGINLGGRMYAPFVAVEIPRPGPQLPWDNRQVVVRGTIGGNYVFRVPSLRNVALTPPYFSSGSVWDLHQAVRGSQLGAPLTDDDVTKITRFLGSLTGNQPAVMLPVLPPSVSEPSRPHP